MLYSEYQSLLVYHGMGKDSFLEALCQTECMTACDATERSIAIHYLHQAFFDLLSLAEEYGWQGDLWQHYLTYLLIAHENPFSLACEKAEVNPNASIAKLAREDLARIYAWFDLDLLDWEDALSESSLSILRDYHPTKAEPTEAGKRISSLCGLLFAAEDEAAFFDALTAYYATHGVGTFGLHHAFSVYAEEAVAELCPVAKPARVTLDDIVGYDQQKQELVQNTKAFSEGKPANNVLLYGDSGTGKSTAVKAVFNEFSNAGLRLIEVNKYQFRALSSIISQIKERHYRFIICIDDLSFEEDESEYKFLKAVIEGGVETNPENVLIYATSNRRHLIRETWKDRSDMEHDGDIHRSDTIEEKLSLASRFGVTINYSVPDKDEYLHIVKTLARREGIDMDEEQLSYEAMRWEIRHGGMSCRVARQFIDSLHTQN